jgi:hypothetical protein
LYLAFREPVIAALNAEGADSVTDARPASAMRPGIQWCEMLENVQAGDEPAL